MNLRKLARGEPCQIRIPGACNDNVETTVLAHYRLAGFCGTGSKPPDWMAAWACSACHDAVDRRHSVTDYTSDALHRMHAEGVLRTIGKLIDMGVIKP